MLINKTKEAKKHCMFKLLPNYKKSTEPEDILKSHSYLDIALFLLAFFGLLFLTIKHLMYYW